MTWTKTCPTATFWPGCHVERGHGEARDGGKESNLRLGRLTSEWKRHDLWIQSSKQRTEQRHQQEPDRRRAHIVTSRVWKCTCDLWPWGHDACQQATNINPSKIIRYQICADFFFILRLEKQWEARSVSTFYFISLMSQYFTKLTSLSATRR